MATRGMTEFRADGVDYTLNDPNIAPEFNAASVYSKGDYVNYQGDLYRLTADHAANDTWANTSKTKIKLGAELATEKANRKTADETETTARENGDASVLNQIAPVFDVDTAYTKGQYVTYNGTLYRLTADHASGTGWSSTSKTAVKISAEINSKEAELESEVTDLKSAFNFSNGNIVTSANTVPGWINEAGAKSNSVDPTLQQRVSEYLPVTQGEKYVAFMSDVSGYYIGVAFYTNNVESSASSALVSRTSYYDYDVFENEKFAFVDITVPANAVYMRIWYTTYGNKNYYLFNVTKQNPIGLIALYSRFDVKKQQEIDDYRLRELISGKRLDFSWFGEFSLGGLNVDGSLLPTQKTRVSSISHIIADYDITISVQSGYRWGYIPFENNTAKSWVGWLTTDQTIKKGTEFVVQISKDPEGSTIANVADYVNALTFYTESVSVFQQVSKNKTDIAKMLPIVKTNENFERIDLNKFTTYNYNLEGSTWQQSFAYRCKIIERSVFANDIMFDAINSNRITFAFLASNNASANVSPDLCTGTTKQTITGGNKRIFPIPSDCNYVYIYISTWSESVITSDLGVYSACLSYSDIEKNTNNPIVDELRLYDKPWDKDYGLQGGCTDGKFIYVIDVQTEGSLYYCNKYDILTGEKSETVTITSNLGHANDMTYNPNTDRIYLVNMDDASGVTVMTRDFVIVETLTINGPSGETMDWYRIAYDRKANKYYLCADMYTVYVYSASFVYEKTVLLSSQPISLTPQGMETDGIYYYMLYIGGIYVYALNGAFVKVLMLNSTRYYEPETICYDWNDNFYLLSAAYYSYMVLKKFTPVEIALNEFKKLDSEKADCEPCRNLIDKRSLYFKALIQHGTGNLVTGSNYVTEFIKVEDGDLLQWRSVDSWYAAFYNENKEYVSDITLTNNIYTVPADGYIRATITPANVASAVICKWMNWGNNSDYVKTAKDVVLQDSFNVAGSHSFKYYCGSVAADGKLNRYVSPSTRVAMYPPIYVSEGKITISVNNPYQWSAGAYKNGNLLTSTAWTSGQGTFIANQCDFIAVTIRKYQNSSEQTMTEYEDFGLTVQIENGIKTYPAYNQTEAHLTEVARKAVTNEIYSFGLGSTIKVMSHLFIDGTYAGSNPIIPSQSIHDVEALARLGIHFAEGNVHRTSDGYYVVSHGNQGKLGSAFETNDGQSVGDVTFAGQTLEQLKTLYRFRSTHEKYRTRILTLEEWLYACVKNNIIPLVQPSAITISKEFTDKVKKITGNKVVISYEGNTNIRDYFDGIVINYSSQTNVNQINNVLQTVGAPFIWCIESIAMASLTESQLKAIVDLVHSYGCLAIIPGFYLTVPQRIMAMRCGFDVLGSGWDVEDFHDGDIDHLIGDITFDDFAHEGTVTNETLVLESGKWISNVNPDNVHIGKGSLHIKFSGTIHIEMGRYIDTDITSDGTEDVWLSTVYLDERPIFNIQTQSAVTVYNLLYDSSKC